MEEFRFSPKQMITICGKEYECDPTNLDLIQGTMRDFPKILALSKELVSLQKKMQDATTARSPRELLELNDRALELNLDLIKACQAFLYGAIGEREYAEIFAGKRPNSVDHIDLCTFVFKYITKGRREMLEGYMDPPKEEPQEVTVDAAQEPAGKDLREKGTNRLWKMVKGLFSA